MAAQAVEVPGLARPQPEVVAGDGVGESDTGGDWLHDVPREGDIGPVLGEGELDGDN